MNRIVKFSGPFGYALAVAAAVVSLTVLPAAGQVTSATARPETTKAKAVAGKTMWTQAKTPDGQPDLQGIWSNATTTPLQRPGSTTGAQVLSDEETANLEKETEADRDADRRRGIGTEADVALAYNQAWYDRGTVLTRRSLITDPENGMLPPLTPEGQKMVDARMAARRSHGPADSWEDRSLQERCMVYHAVPPLPTGYNNNYQIVQIPGYVTILSEMIHEIRVIPLDGRPHLPSNVRQWLGDSRGRWEGNTLVVETTNFVDQPNLFRFPANSNTVKVTERFKRVDADHIDYKFTINDPFTYQRPWTAILPMTKIEGPIYEYACHEGNYGMRGILSGARADDAAAAAASKTSSR